MLAGGCRGSTPGEVEPFRPGWSAVALPPPAGPPGRLVLRDVAACAGRWFAVGAVRAADGATRPAAWASTDARTWTALAVTGTSHYGRQNILYAAACRDGRLAAIGSKVGGVHGNPRVSTWAQADEGRLAEVPTPFERFGGPEAVNVARMVGGPPGWLIVGNRVRGAAVWLSADATEFELVDGAPELASDARGRTWVFDAVATTQGWLAVGAVRHTGRTTPEPVAWTSGDGRTWRRLDVPVAGGSGELQRVATVDGVPVAVGLSDGRFGAWRAGGDGWARVGRFGTVTGPGLPSVRGVAVAGDRLVVAVVDGSGHELWTSTDHGGSWRRIVAPLGTAQLDGDSGIAVATAGDRLLLAVDDAGGATMWLTGIH